MVFYLLYASKIKIHIYKAYVIGKSNNKICFQFFEVEKRVALSLTSTNITTTFHAHVTKYNYNDKKIMMEMIATENDETYKGMSVNFFFFRLNDF